jgi:hypothetical protein
VRLLSGQRQKHTVLQSFVEFLLELRTHLGPYAAATLLKATVEFFNGLLLERGHNHDLRVPLGATAFPSYLRTVTGFAEPFAHFVFCQTKFPEARYLHRYLGCVPDLIAYINYTNDVISFYKESIVGEERVNYICNVAKTRGIGQSEALRVVSREVCDTVKSIRLALREEPEMTEVVEDFFRSYVLFHLNQPRYQLMEVVADILKGSGEEDGLNVCHKGFMIETRATL